MLKNNNLEFQICFLLKEIKTKHNNIQYVFFHNHIKHQLRPTFKLYNTLFAVKTISPISMKKYKKSYKIIECLNVEERRYSLIGNGIRVHSLIFFYNRLYTSYNLWYTIVIVRKSRYYQLISTILKLYDLSFPSTFMCRFDNKLRNCIIRIISCFFSKLSSYSLSTEVYPECPTMKSSMRIPEIQTNVVASPSWRQQNTYHF